MLARRRGEEEEKRSPKRLHDFSTVPSGRTGRKGRMLPSAFVQVEATHDLGTSAIRLWCSTQHLVRMEPDCLRVLKLRRQAAGGVTPQDERNAWIDR
jgi:hypothetical protein